MLVVLVKYLHSVHNNSMSKCQYSSGPDLPDPLLVFSWKVLFRFSSKKWKCDWEKRLCWRAKETRGKINFLGRKQGRKHWGRGDDAVGKAGAVTSGDYSRPQLKHYHKCAPGLGRCRRMAPDHPHHQQQLPCHHPLLLWTCNVGRKTSWTDSLMNIWLSLSVDFLPNNAQHSALELESQPEYDAVSDLVVIPVPRRSEIQDQ